MSSNDLIPSIFMSYETLNEILDDLTTRFIINIPQNELESIERLLFQIELAHWFYEDYILEEHKQLKKGINSLKLHSFSLKQFSLLLFQNCILLKHWVPKHEKAFDTFMKYKTKVPVCGAIILNTDMTKVLLVRGWKSGSSWGFPKGKINQDEAEPSCAIREVFEETGFDMSAYLREQEFLERRIYEQRVRLYMIAGIEESVEFVTQTKKEIGDIKWHSLNSIPGFVKNSSVSEDDFIHSRNKKYKYYMTTPFVVSIRKWIAKFKAAKSAGKDRNRADLQVTMDEEEAGNDSDADLLNQAVTEQHHAYYLQQNPTVDQYSSAIVPQTQRVELEESLKSLLGMGGGGQMYPIQPHQPYPHQIYSQPMNIPFHHAQPTFPSTHHVGSFPHHQSPFGSFGHPGPHMFSPVIRPNIIPMGPTYSHPPPPPGEEVRDLQEEEQLQFEADEDLAVDEDVASAELESKVEQRAPSPDRARKTALLDILMGASPIEPNPAQNVKKGGTQPIEPNPTQNVNGIQPIEPNPAPFATENDRIQLTKEAERESLLGLLMPPNKIDLPKQIKGGVIDASVAIEPSPRKKGKAAGNTKPFAEKLEEGGSGVKKSPKKNKKKEIVAGLQFGSVQILKRPTNPSSTTPSTSHATPASTLKVNSPQTASSKKQDGPVVKTVRRDSSSHLLDIIHSSRKNSGAESQSLLDVLFNGAAPKSISDDPGLELALSGRTLSRSSSVTSARILSPAILSRERPSLVDILMGVPAPPQTPPNLDYVSPTSPKVRPPVSPERPMIAANAKITNSSGLMDIWTFSGRGSSSSASAHKSTKSPVSVLSPSQQSLVDILQGIPKPPSISHSNITASSGKSHPITNGSEPSTSLDNQSSSGAEPPEKVNNDEARKSSLMDILLGLA